MICFICFDTMESIIDHVYKPGLVLPQPVVIGHKCMYCRSIINDLQPPDNYSSEEIELFKKKLVIKLRYVEVMNNNTPIPKGYSMP